jgi:hypothetical protein
MVKLSFPHLKIQNGLPDEKPLNAYAPRDLYVNTESYIDHVPTDGPAYGLGTSFSYHILHSLYICKINVCIFILFISCHIFFIFWGRFGGAYGGAPFFCCFRLISILLSCHERSDGYSTTLSGEGLLFIDHVVSNFYKFGFITEMNDIRWKPV